jgi:5S rRNA maturation endonuclease (ribonuclease M5)
VTPPNERRDLLAATDLGALLVELTGVDSRGHSYPCPNPDHEQTGTTPPVTIAESRDGYQVWRCHACAGGGTAIDALMLARGLDAGGAIAELRARTGREQAPQRTKERKREPEPLPSEDQLADSTQRLVDDRRIVERLHELRGWTRDALAELGVGYDRERQRLVFPVRDGHGNPVNVCRYSPAPKGGERKMVSLAGRPRDLFPAPESIEGDEVWVVEGEPDAVAAHSVGLPGVALPGVEFAKRLDVERFRRFSRVHVLLDCDAQGRTAATQLGERLANAGIEVRMLDLDPSRDDGYDLGDLVREAAELGVEGLAQARTLLQRVAADARRVPIVRAEETSDGAAQRSLVAESFVGIRAERTRWLWEGRIPLGTATLLVGREKLGKSTLTGELAARLSRGDLEGDLAGRPADTLIVSYEDSAARTIKPRLMAAGADLSRVHRVLAKRGSVRDLVSLPDDVLRVGELARERGARLVIVDPLSASLNGEINAHRDQDIRRALAPLVQLAEEADLAILALAHWNKSPGGDALSRVLGSRGLTAAVRSVLAFGRSPDAEEDSPDRVLAHAACNLAPEAPALACRLEGRQVHGDDGEPIPTSRLVIVGETDAHADDLLVTRSSDDMSDRDQAADWLADELADGEPHETREIIERAKAAGISRATLYRAVKALDVEKGDTGAFPKRATWRLPAVSRTLVAPETTGDETTAKTPVVTGDAPHLPSLLSQSSKTETTGANLRLVDDPQPQRMVADLSDAELLARFPSSTLEHVHTGGNASAAANGRGTNDDLERVERNVEKHGGAS